jgi:hypothetical protein
MKTTTSTRSVHVIFTLVYLGFRGAIVTAAICAAVKVMDILPVAAIVDFMQGIKPRVKAEETLHTVCVKEN